MRPSKLARTLVESNDSGKVYWVKVTIKHEGLPQDQKDLFFRGVEGLLMKCVMRQEGLARLHRLHYDICGIDLNVGLYRRL